MKKLRCPRCNMGLVFKSPKNENFWKWLSSDVAKITLFVLVIGTIFSVLLISLGSVRDAAFGAGPFFIIGLIILALSLRSGGGDEPTSLEDKWL